MIILALDSTAIAGSVALCRDEQVLALFQLHNGNTHSETLLPMVEAILKTAGLTVKDVDLFAVTAGPGSFTGVRIGVATVKGLAFGKNKPCVGVSALEALAENLMPCDGVICPMMNARRGQVYNALFRAENGVMHRICEDRAISVEDLKQDLTAYGEPILLCGDGAALLTNTKGLLIASTPALLNDANAASVAKCAYRMAKNGQTVRDTALSPVYLRLPQAERERLAKEKQLQEKEGPK